MTTNEHKQLDLFPYLDFDEYQAFDEYQNWTDTTEVYSGNQGSYFYPILGLVSEVGELAALLKREIRGDNEKHFREKMVKELGDCLWYLARVAKEEEISLSEVVAGNIKKLDSRKERNILKGSGDDR